MTVGFAASDAVLLAVQASLVALPGRGVPAPLARVGGRAWALVLPLSIGAVVAAVAAVPDVADFLTWLAFLAIPPLAAATLASAARGARPAAGLVAIPLLVLAWADQGSLVGDGAAVALTALSCVTLGRLLAGIVPAAYLEVGIVAMAIVDAILVFGNQLQRPNAVIEAAAPAQGLPKLQYLAFGSASMGYGDVFVAAVLGGVLAAQGVRQVPVARLTFALAVAWDVLFLVFDTLPATVPVAAATLLTATARRAVRTA